MNTTILISRPHKFVAIPLSLFRANLSAAAIGVYCFLLSLDQPEVSCRIIRRRLRLQVGVLETILSELEGAGIARCVSDGCVAISDQLGEIKPEERKPAKADDTPYADIRAMWKRMLPELPVPLTVEHWTEARKKTIRARWNDQLPSLDLWERAFLKIRASDFLMGRTKHQFRCGLFWICEPRNLLKLWEGGYA